MLLLKGNGQVYLDFSGNSIMINDIFKDYFFIFLCFLVSSFYHPSHFTPLSY